MTKWLEHYSKHSIIKPLRVFNGFENRVNDLWASRMIWIETKQKKMKDTSSSSCSTRLSDRFGNSHRGRDGQHESDVDCLLRLLVHIHIRERSRRTWRAQNWHSIEIDLQSSCRGHDVPLLHFKCDAFRCWRGWLLWRYMKERRLCGRRRSLRGTALVLLRCITLWALLHVSRRRSVTLCWNWNCNLFLKKRTLICHAIIHLFGV